MNLYTIYDELAKKCSPIFEQDNDELALRHFEVMMETIPKAVSRDMSLYKLGKRSDSGMIINLFPESEKIDVSTLLNPKED